MDIQILVVEDDEHICNTVKTFLQSEGYHVDAFFHGEKALEMSFKTAISVFLLTGFFLDLILLLNHNTTGRSI